MPFLETRKPSAFLIDRYEVTNRQFKHFIDEGGYRKPEYWKQEFLQDGRKLSREEAMQSFRDPTGRPGPSTWSAGGYPQGHGEDPVGGVSWYEAAAYAEFAGKQLPTIWHWQRAANPGPFADIVLFSNFAGAGPAKVGAYKGLGVYGTFDMAGNVREWCWNETGGLRYIRGGAWSDPAYMFAALDTQPVWDRSAQNGLRCIRYDVSSEASLREPASRQMPDPRSKKPVSDEVFRVYQSLYAYDPADLNARVEGVDEDNTFWRREKVSFSAAYGNERVLGYLYLPKNSPPPYQAIVYASPLFAMDFPTPQALEEQAFDFIIKSGRAFLLPVLKGQYERRYTTPATGLNESRDRRILESKDFRRSIDYLVSRRDIDGAHLGAFGMSYGGILPLLAVDERRLKAASLLSVGLYTGPKLPEADVFNFLPRYRVPTLMINGDLDFIFPLETTARPFFELLGTPRGDKRLLLWKGGHSPPDGQSAINRKETLDWYDKYLGPVK